MTKAEAMIEKGDIAFIALCICRKTEISCFRDVGTKNNSDFTFSRNTLMTRHSNNKKILSVVKTVIYYRQMHLHISDRASYIT